MMDVECFMPLHDVEEDRRPVLENEWQKRVCKENASLAKSQFASYEKNV
jgi:hypothetical protein